MYLCINSYIMFYVFRFGSFARIIHTGTLSIHSIGIFYSPRHDDFGTHQLTEVVAIMLLSSSLRAVAPGGRAY